MKIDDLEQFIDKAGRATYAGRGKKERNPERKGFAEMVFSEGDFNYRDSWTGYIR